VLETYVSPKIGIFKKNGAKNLNFLLSQHGMNNEIIEVITKIGYEQ
jgi:hypothetical protein